MQFEHAEKVVLRRLNQAYPRQRGETKQDWNSRLDWVWNRHLRAAAHACFEGLGKGMGHAAYKSFGRSEPIALVILGRVSLDLQRSLRFNRRPN